MYGHNGFPPITHLSQVLRAVEGRNDFAVKTRDGYTAVDYIFAGPDSFDDPIRRECRGIKFGPRDQIIGRPFHKFFNVGEKVETQLDVLLWDHGHVVLEKLDGSMVHPAMVMGELVWMTRAGITDISEDAGRWAKANGLEDRARSLLFDGITPIFEWCSPRNQIVIRYPDDRMVLTGAREMVTGRYLPIEYLGFPHVVSTWGSSVGDLAEFMAHVRGLKDAEGYVVRWHSGAMVKIKADDYVTRHKARDSILLEKNVLRIVLEGAVDDVLPLLAPEDAARLSAYQAEIAAALSREAAGLHETVASAKALMGEDRKRFALEVVAPVNPIWKGPLFAVWSGADPREAVRTALLKHCGSATDIEAIRPVIGAEWNAPIAA
jgi:RNA ligase